MGLSGLPGRLSPPQTGGLEKSTTKEKDEFMSKKCTHCKTEKPNTLEYFHRRSTSKDGLAPHCKICSRNYNRERAKRPEVRERELDRSRQRRPSRKAYFAKYQKRTDVKDRHNARRRAARANATFRKPKRPETPEARQRRLEWQRRNNKRYHKTLMERRRERYKSDPLYKIRMNVAREMRKQLATGKGRKRWQDAVGYSIEDLRSHLERQFTKDMSWRNYGMNGWHIDHIIPVVEFKIKEFGDAEFKACWALSNLRPLWAKANITKRHHRELLL